MSEHQTSIDKPLQCPISTVSFYVLPPDVRLLIYNYIFEPTVLLITLRPVRKHEIVTRFAESDAATHSEFAPQDFSIRKPFPDTCDQPQRAPNLDVLYLSKTIRAETLPTFYANFTFSFFQPDLYECFSTSLPAEHRQCIRHVALDFGLNWLQEFYGDNGDDYELRVLYERQTFQTSYSPERMHRIFSKEASGEEWYGTLLPPTLHCLEARMWNFLDIDGIDDFVDLNYNLVFDVDDDCAISEKVEELRVLNNHLAGMDPRGTPDSLLRAGAKLSYKVSTSQCSAASIPVPLWCFINGGEATLRRYPRLRVGILCLNVSLKKTCKVEERMNRLGEANEVGHMMDLMWSESLRGDFDKEYLELTSWG